MPDRWQRGVSAGGGGPEARGWGSDYSVPGVLGHCGDPPGQVLRLHSKKSREKLTICLSSLTWPQSYKPRGDSVFMNRVSKMPRILECIEFGDISLLPNR